ncbi:MAG: DUF3604 domain-containing protein [Proteobacteria bacterium]|nr:DUF3604 domain-containing protein [Pseudomonadota bacterium]
MKTRLALASSLLLLVTACTEEVGLIDEDSNFGGRGGDPLEPVMDVLDRTPPLPNPLRNAYFGDLHVHTEYSFDAYNFGTTATPYDAYRFALGEAIEHPAGYQIQMATPLDFYAVTDHAMFLGLALEAGDTTTPFSQYEVSKPLHNLNAEDNMGSLSLTTRLGNFATFIPDTLAGIRSGTISEEMAIGVTRRAWADIINAAEQYNDPGRFTTFVAYEYTSSTDDVGNLHRNVVFRGADKLPAVPFSRLNSQNPEGLWDWMDTLREQGIESLAIPHNSNGSNGQMFKLVDWAGDPMDNAYADQRMRNEPIVEITQVKGTSDTHPLLSPNDEWADFEIYKFRVGTSLHSEEKGSYVREALRNGLALEAQGVKNPYQFGFVAASDTHVAGTSDDEETYFSKAGLLDGLPERRGSVPVDPVYGLIARFLAPDTLTEVDGSTYTYGGGFESWSASGVTGVWAEENTRDAIYDAFRRKETFATSGPRMRVRFFAGHDYDSDILTSDTMIEQAYAGGVAMGGELTKTDEAPRFVAWASADPRGTALQRLQIIKGWEKAGETYEQVYDVACSDGLTPDPETHRCGDNGARVDIADCSITQGVGAAELKTVWQDPDYDPDSRAFYYVRALENPTCRWSTWDANRAGVKPRPDLPTTLQERVWSSPIWVR